MHSLPRGAHAQQGLCDRLWWCRDIREYDSTPYVGMSGISHRDNTMYMKPYLSSERTFLAKICYRQTSGHLEDTVKRFQLRTYYQIQDIRI